MSLKPLPFEKPSDEEIQGGKYEEKKQKSDTSVNFSAPNNDEGGFFRSAFNRFTHFLSKGSHYTVEQIDELIHTLQRCILRLQKEKVKRMQKKFSK
ncbi:MAG: hypothetical protein AAB592_00315 [Patescibacteria group bacterium]